MYATPSCLRIVSGMFQSPDFVKARKRQVEVEQGKEREKEPWKRNKGRKRMYKFKVSGSSLCGFAVLSLFLPNLHTEEEHVRDKKENGAKKRQPF